MSPRPIIEEIHGPGILESRVIDANGQQIALLEDLVKPLEAQINGLQRDVRGWSMRYGELKRDKARLAKEHPLYADAKGAFEEWKRRCNHRRSPFTAERFWLVVPYLENPKYGLRMVLRAIRGAEHDAFEVARKNGSRKRFDEWERIFKDAGTFEEFVNRAPREQLALGSQPEEDAA